MSATPSPETIRKNRERGKRRARALHMSDVSTICDALVLGEFDWRDYFEDKPPPGFLSGFSDECFYREQTS